MGSIGVLASQLVAVDTANPPRKGIFGKSKQRTTFGLQFRFDRFSDKEESFPQRVKYYDAKPSFDYPRSDNMAELFNTVFLSKACSWRYQKEWRVVDWPTKAGVRSFPPNLLTGLILGARMSEEDREWILDLAGSQQREIRKYRTHTEKDKFALTLEELSE